VALRTAGIGEIIVARLDPGDVGEDEAARRLAQKLAGPGVRVEPPFTGRSNLFSEASGVLMVDVEGLGRVNDVDEAVTFATLPPYRTVTEGEMIGTVKIIPFAVTQEILSRAAAATERPVIEVRPFAPLGVGVISTLLPGLKPSVVDKTLRALAARLAPAQAVIRAETRAPHDVAALADAIRRMAEDCDLIIVFGASAITDRRDVIPAAVIEAGGAIERLGMPVDPGNLLLLARTAQGRPLLGAPGCARSPKENGFDWVLHRLLAGVEVRPADIRAMGAGGLLMEIISRPQPRAEARIDVASHAERLDADE
jgi:molybdenum cofactor cytidylyltransferase